jgi:hypothetical protein
MTRLVQIQPELHAPAETQQTQGLIDNLSQSGGPGRGSEKFSTLSFMTKSRHLLLAANSDVSGSHCSSTSTRTQSPEARRRDEQMKRMSEAIKQLQRSNQNLREELATVRSRRTLLASSTRDAREDRRAQGVEGEVHAPPQTDTPLSKK